MDADIENNTNYFSGLTAACSGGEILKKKVTLFKIALLQMCAVMFHSKSTTKAKSKFLSNLEGFADCWKFECYSPSCVLLPADLFCERLRRENQKLWGLYNGEHDSS